MVRRHAAVGGARAAAGAGDRHSAENTGLQNLVAFRDGEAACFEGAADDAG